MYHVSAQGVDERMINVHYYYYSTQSPKPCTIGVKCGQCHHNKNSSSGDYILSMFDINYIHA